MERSFIDNSDCDEDDDVEDDSHQEESPKKFETKADALIYLIDAREKMFLPSFEEDKLPIIRCLECIRKAVRMKIFRLEKCLCSIILLGTKKVENALSLSNITVVKELNFLEADHVLKIDGLIKDIENLTYEKKYGYDKFSLGDAFWLSSHTFNQRSRNLNKTIILFTNDDNPTCDDSNDINRAVANAQDMWKSSVTFDLITLGKNFDVDKFYKKIVLASKNDANYVIPDPVDNINEMFDRITTVNSKHVSLTKLPFFISDEFQISVSVHFLVKRLKIPFKIKLSKATNEKVTTKIQYFEEETGSVVKSEDIIKSQFVAGKEINFRISELKAIQAFGKREFRLLGFKPVSVLKVENFIKPCAFIYPDDSEYQGSSVFFTALLKRCLAKEVVPICTFCPRTSSSNRFVALIPQDEPQSNKKIQQLMPGFIVFFLPFAEEVRKFEPRPTKRATSEQVDIAVKLIKKLKSPYRVGFFQNPKIRHHWAAIEALALDLNEPEEVYDCTIPNYDLISQRLGQISEDFLKSVYKDGYNPEDFAPPKKPRPKFVKLKIEGSVEEVEEYVRQGKGEVLSNDVLKSYLKSVGITKGLSKIKKADLLEKVRAHLNLD